MPARKRHAHRIKGLLLGLVVLILDQLSKYWMLYIFDIPNRSPVEVTPFFNLVMVWNYGVSFGMLAQPGTSVPFFLIGVAIVITGALLFWLFQNDDKWLSLAIGGVIGGAIGNVIDRFLYGAVADFLDFHIAGYHWPAFNLADSAIVLGVGFLLYDSIFRQPLREKSSE